MSQHPAPTDGGALSTEQVVDRFARIDQMTVAELVATMNRADAEVAGAVARALPRISAAIEAISERFWAGGRLIYAGAGTSGRLGVVDSAECPPTFHIDPSRVVGIIAGGRGAMFEAVEGAEDDPQRGAQDMRELGIGTLDSVVGLSASGRAPYVMGALRTARRAGALTVAVACHEPSDTGRIAEHAIELVVGGEVIAGSTRLRAGTAQKMVLNMISTIAMVRSGRTYGNLMVDLRVSNAKLADRAARIVMQVSDTTRDEADAALAAAGFEPKTAIVMLAFHEPAEAARLRLLAAGGRLAQVIGPAVGAPAAADARPVLDQGS